MPAGLLLGRNMALPTGKRPRILIVDDELTFLESVSHYLATLFDVTSASTIEEALDLFRKQDFDAVVADLVFGPTERDDGISLIRDLKTIKPRTPIIVFSAFTFERYSADLDRLGISGFLSKAGGLDDLSEAIANAIERGRDVSGGFPRDSDVLVQVRTLLLQEIDRYSLIKERTLTIPGEGHFDLLKPIIGFKRDIERQLTHFPYAENVFLMMKFRGSNSELGEFIIESLRSHGLRGVRADLPEWNITKNVYNPVAVLYCCKYGIALFDEPEPSQAYSANVAYELGMMHYQGKDCLILKHSSLPQIPFDLIKDLYVSYDKDLSLRRFIASWIDQITKN